MDKSIIDRLVYVEEIYAGEVELWQDPVTNTYYHVPIEIVRDFDNTRKEGLSFSLSKNSNA